MVTTASLIPTISVGKGAAGNPAEETQPNRHAHGKPTIEVGNQKHTASVGNITEGIHTSSVGNITKSTSSVGNKPEGINTSSVGNERCASNFTGRSGKVDTSKTTRL